MVKSVLATMLCWTCKWIDLASCKHMEDMMLQMHTITISSNYCAATVVYLVCLLLNYLHVPVPPHVLVLDCKGVRKHV